MYPFNVVSYFSTEQFTNLCWPTQGNDFLPCRQAAVGELWLCHWRHGTSISHLLGDDHVCHGRKELRM